MTCFLFQANVNIHFVRMNCTLHKYVLWFFVTGDDHNAFPKSHSFIVSSNVCK